MPRSKDEYARMRAEAQDKILDTAIAVFSKKGFSGTSINDIAEAANISNGLMYRYFTSKQDLFDKIIDMAVEGLQALTHLTSNSNTPRETFEMICREILDSLNDENYLKLSLMITQGILSQDSHAFEKILRADEEMIKAFEGLIKQGQNQGVFVQGDPVAKTNLLLSSFQGILLMKTVFKEQFRPPTVADMMSFLLREDNNGNDN